MTPDAAIEAAGPHAAPPVWAVAASASAAPTSAFAAPTSASAAPTSASAALTSAAAGPPLPARGPGAPDRPPPPDVDIADPVGELRGRRPLELAASAGVVHSVWITQPLAGAVLSWRVDDLLSFDFAAHGTRGEAPAGLSELLRAVNLASLGRQPPYPRIRSHTSLAARWAPIDGVVTAARHRADVDVFATTGVGLVRTRDDFPVFCDDCLDTTREWHPSVDLALGVRVALDAGWSFRAEWGAPLWIEAVGPSDVERMQPRGLRVAIGRVLVRPTVDAVARAE